jgi:hypothetical protein
MSERIRKRQNNTNCKNYCPILPVFSETTNSINQSNTLRLAALIKNNKKRPVIVNMPVNALGGRSGSLGGLRGIPKNSLV